MNQNDFVRKKIYCWDKYVIDLESFFSSIRFISISCL